MSLKRLGAYFRQSINTHTSFHVHTITLCYRIPMRNKRRVLIARTPLLISVNDYQRNLLGLPYSSVTFRLWSNDLQTKIIIVL